MPLLRSASLLICLFLFWLLLSGYFTPFLLAAGVGSSLAVLALAHRLRLVDAESHPLEIGGRLALYWLWLLKEIAKSGWAVTRIVLSPSLPISPTMLRFVPTQRGDLGLVVHANSITLTPGTIAVECEPGRFVVHGLTRDSAEGCVDSEMDRRVSACEAA